MSVPKQRRTKEHRRDRRAQYAVKLATTSPSGALPHRVSADHPMYKGRDYSAVFNKKSDKKA